MRRELKQIDLTVLRETFNMDGEKMRVPVQVLLLPAVGLRFGVYTDLHGEDPLKDIIATCDESNAKNRRTVQFRFPGGCENVLFPTEEAARDCVLRLNHVLDQGFNYEDPETEKPIEVMHIEVYEEGYDPELRQRMIDDRAGEF